jgi:hypothetical protein
VIQREEELVGTGRLRSIASPDLRKRGRRHPKRLLVVRSSDEISHDDR